MFDSVQNACCRRTAARLRQTDSAKTFAMALLTDAVWPAALVITVLIQAAPAWAQNTRSAFAKVRFGDQVQAELPRNWTYADKRIANDLNTASEAVAQNLGLPLNQGDNVILIAGNALDDQGKTRATLRISLRVASTATQTNMQEFARLPASEIQAALRPQADEGIKAMLQMPGVVSYAVKWVKMDRNAFMTCMQSRFEGVLSTGPKVSDTWVCPLGNSTIKLTTSYDKTLQSLYEPIVARVWRSLRVPPTK